MSATDAQELPEGWALAQLRELTSPSSVKVDPEERPTSPYLSLEHIEPHTNRIIGQGVGEDVNSTKAVFHFGDVLYGKLRPYLNKVAIPDFDGICSTDILVFPKAEHLDNRLLMHFLTRREVVEFANHNSSGVQLPRVGFRELGSLEVPVPPLAEQRRIATAVERLLEKVGAARERLERVPNTLKGFRRAVLAAACSGRLTGDWREKNPDVEPASKLIREERFQFSENEERCHEIPESWAYVPLGNFARCSRGRFLVRPRNDPSYFGGPYPFIQIGNLPPEGGWVTSHSQTLNEKGLRVSKMFPKGTVAIAIVGATIGNTGLLAYDMCFTDSVVGIESNSEDGNLYIELFLQHRKRAIRKSSYASGGQPNINLDVLNRYPIALPPLPEQREIVRRVSELVALSNTIEQRAKSALRRVEMSTQAVLAKAFRGELVPTEAELARREGRSYETASELLARVKTSTNGETKQVRARKSSKRLPASDENLLEFMED